MQIVVLDGFTLNPGDLDWKDLKTLGELTVYDRTAPENIIEQAKDAEIILTNKVVLNENVLSKLSNLKYIGVLATGYNVVDIQYAKSRGIFVTNVPAYSTNSVAQLTFSLILELVQNVGLHSNCVRNGEWSSSKDFCFLKKPMVELDGLTLGIIGFGQIGRAVSKIARVFGLNVLVVSGHKITDDSKIENVDLEKLLKKSDIVTLHCPLTKDTENIINSEKLSIMKPSAFLINSGRGPLINERDLANALNDGLIAGAALDVLSKEPPEADNPLLKASNCIITPHVAWATLAARKRLMTVAVKNIKSFIDGNCQNIVG